MKKKAFILEDEPFGLENLKNHLSEYCPEVEIIGEADTLRTGIDMLRNPDFRPDLAFLDINLPDGLVFKLLEGLEEISFEIIFITAYENYAIKACEFSSIGYILKPIDKDELVQAVSRVISHPPEETNKRLQLFDQIYRNPNAFKKMSISAIDGIYFVNLQDIVRFEADDNYTHIYLNDGSRITASKTIKSYDEMLQDLNFFRVHKRHVINMNYMQKYVKGEGSYILMVDGKQIEVSRRRRPAFMEQIKSLQASF